MKILIALGGNALLWRSEKPDIKLQRARLDRIRTPINTIAESNNLIIVHGNGPQIGLIAHESETDASLVTPYPLDTLGAETQGMIGYWISQIIDQKYKPVVVFTRTFVKVDDSNKKKFIGRVYTSEAEAQQMAEKYGWEIDQDGNKWRRIVASPEPIAVVESQALDLLISNNHTVICGGGGGVPIDIETNKGVEGVIDKDLTASLIAQHLNVELFLISTNIGGIYTEWHGRRPENKYLIKDISCDEIEKMEFNKTIEAKVMGMARYVKAVKRTGIIGSMETVHQISQGVDIQELNGTRIHP